MGAEENEATYYVGNVEFMVKANGTTVVKRYVGDAVITRYSDNINKISYLHRDHLGSVQTVTSQNYSELTTEHLSYDAYGRRRDAGNNSSIITQNPISDVTKRGYTGQEHVDQLGVINYNARLYDPELGMMLQADTMIPDGPVTQSLNRYSYVFNNPLSYTDPTGHSPIGWPNPYSLQRLDALNTVDDLQQEAVDRNHAEQQQMAVTPQGMHEAVVGIHQFDGVGVQFNPETFEIEKEGMLEGIVGPMFKNLGRDLSNSVAGFNEMFIYPTTDLLGAVGDRVDPVVNTLATMGPLGNGPRGLAFGVGKILKGIGGLKSFVKGFGNNKLPMLEVSKSGNMPNIAKNIENAISNGAPSELNRVTSKSQIRKNRRDALRGHEAAGKGKSLDEFPFASCSQGGAGSCVSPVPVTEQNIQGGQLSQFYQRNNIGDGDAFKVKVVE